eukprot:TRINITY_DN28614_c0_g1_i1.p1 TRINITY_DN28614_c0_g1~~TRINITY_DN28614_c0_g1_i1.p1  ORF type:complete len:383 (+),score=85.19 TRINITY_DN28614_c0_g1_i1:76-1149(+)
MAGGCKFPPLADALAFATNVVSSVGIIMVNKQLMSSTGVGFNYPVCLSALHFLLTSAVSKAVKAATPQKVPSAAESDISSSGSLPPRFTAVDIAIFVIVSNTSIISLNTSLMLNSVSLYQLAKLGIPPFTAMVETFWLGKRFSLMQILFMAVTLCGVGMVSVSEFKVTGSVAGLVAAAMSVTGSSMQQVLCGYHQNRCKISSNEMLGAVTPWQGVTLLALSPPIDYAMTGAWVAQFQWTRWAIFFVVLSCSAAAAVNMSHFMCLGRFSAVSFQVMGHIKTMSVVAIGSMVFGAIYNQQQYIGVALCVTGMIGYACVVGQQLRPQERLSPKPTPVGPPPRSPPISGAQGLRGVEQPAE